VLSISGDAKIYLCLKPVDLKKGFDLLAAIVEELYPQKLLTFVFLINSEIASTFYTGM
jgi:hypothetical protein